MNSPGREDGRFGDPMRRLDGMAALSAATEERPMRKRKGERDTEFVKRVVRSYLKAEAALSAAIPHQGQAPGDGA